MPGIPQNGRPQLLFHARKITKWAASPPILGGSGHEVKGVADHFGGFRAWIPERSDFFKGPNGNAPTSKIIIFCFINGERGLREFSLRGPLRWLRGGLRDRGCAEGVARRVARRGLARVLSSSWTLNSIVFVGGPRFFKLPYSRERVVIFEVIGC